MCRKQTYCAWFGGIVENTLYSITLEKKRLKMGNHDPKQMRLKNERRE